MNLELLKQKYQSLQNQPENQSKPITLKQQDYLLKLHQESQLAELDFFSAVKQLLDSPVNDWSELTQKQIRYLINNAFPKQIKTKSGHTLYQKRLRKQRQKAVFKVRDFPLISTIEYEYGYQLKDLPDQSDQYRFYYLRFYQLAMLDFDDQAWTVVKSKLKRAATIISLAQPIRFRVYQTYNGFRIFLVSQPVHYRSQLAFNLLKQLEVDPWYLSFYQHHGFKVRVSSKPDRQEIEIAKYQGDYLVEIDQTDLSQGKIKKVELTMTLSLDPSLDQLLKIHDQTCRKF